jgi:hypothetical protein
MMRCLQDIMCNNLMWVTMCDQFASSLGIQDNQKRLDYPWIFIILLSFFFCVESLLCYLRFSVFSYTSCKHILIQQTRTAESEVLQTSLRSLPLTLLQNPKTAEFHENRASIRLVCRIRRFIFILYLQQTQYEPMLTVTVASHQRPNSFLRPSPARFINTPTKLWHSVTTHMLELKS